MEEEQPQSPTSSEEDEVGELVNDKLQGKFLSVLAKLRTKDPEIYKIDKPVFVEDDFEEVQQKEKKEDKQKNKFTYKDMERERILKKATGNGVQEDDQMELEQDQVDPTPYELQKKLKKDFQKSAFAAQANDEGDLFKVKKSVKVKPVSMQTEDQKLRKLAKNKKQQEVFQRFWGDNSKLDDTDLFLKRYILNKGWIDEEGQTKKFNKKIDKEDEQRSEQMEQYEQKFNHRFEQPSGAHLQMFPRRIDQSMRLKQKQTRKDKRAKKEQMKKDKLNEELKQAEKLKRQKKKQISERIAEIQKQKGIHNIEVQQEQYEEDNGEDKVWFYCDDCQRGFEQYQTYYTCPNPTCEGYSLCKQCQQLIIHKHNLEQATVPQGCGAPDPQQVQRTLSNILKCRKCKYSIGEYDKRYELIDPESNFKYNYCAECQDLLPLSLRKRCKEVKEEKVKLDEVLERDPEKLKDYVDDDEVTRLLREYEGLDFNQVIADGVKTKFKYIDVKPESYGLSDEQILYSDDRELNKYVSIKKLAPYIEQNLRLRNNVYKTKIKSISKSAKLNKKRVEQLKEDPQYGQKRLKLLKQRAQRRKKNVQRNAQQLNRLRITDLSTKDAQLKHFVPKSRLQSYGITQ